MSRPFRFVPPVLGALALSLAPLAPVAEAQYPVPRVPESVETTDAAFHLFDEGRWPEALEAFESAARDARTPLPPEALRRWGVAASENGRPLTAYVRLSQTRTRETMQAAFPRFAGRAKQAVPGQGGWTYAEPPYAKEGRGGGVGRIIRPLGPMFLSRAC